MSLTDTAVKSAKASEKAYKLSDAKWTSPVSVDSF
jgi:hypothetical protein